MKNILVEGVPLKDVEAVREALVKQGFDPEIKTMKRAIVTGVTGQDGAYLSKFLLEKGYAVSFRLSLHLSKSNCRRRQENESYGF
jgi:hypothetical protein